MKLAILSDLHIDLFLDGRAYLLDKLPAADAAIIAGDLCELNSEQSYKLALSFIKSLAKIYPHIYYVNGNHDCWGGSILTTAKRTEDISKEVPEFHFVDSTKEYKLGDYKIVGDTLWFREDSVEAEYLSRYWIDYHRVYAEYGAFQKEYEKFVAEVLPKVDEKTIIISHHMPHNKCVADEWVGNDTNVFFVNDMESFILSKKPKLWVCGHTHNPVDVMVNDTRVYCNPGGYDYEGRNPDFLSRIVINI